MEKIAVVGFNGRMGRLICKALQKDYTVLGVGKDNKLDDFKNIDLVVDFATHESSLKSAEFCLKRKIPLIIGSTGQTEVENKRIDEISKEIKIIKKANFSRGIDVLKGVIDSVIMLNPLKIEIIEKHHINKKDKPSGTALELKKYVEKGYNGEVEIDSIREGDEMGEHIIVAHLEDEVISIKHNVFSRECFVKGVVEEIKKIF